MSSRTPGWIPLVYKIHSSRLILMGNKSEGLIRNDDEEEQNPQIPIYKLRSGPINEYNMNISAST
jgi:hypothetical protein